MHFFPAIFWVASHYMNHLPSVPLLCHSYEAGSQDTTCWLASFYQVSLGPVQDATEWCQVLCFLLCFQHHYEIICSLPWLPGQSLAVSGVISLHFCFMPLSVCSQHPGPGLSPRCLFVSQTWLCSCLPLPRLWPEEDLCLHLIRTGQVTVLKQLQLRL